MPEIGILFLPTLQKNQILWANKTEQAVDIHLSVPLTWTASETPSSLRGLGVEDLGRPSLDGAGVSLGGAQLLGVVALC